MCLGYPKTQDLRLLTGIRARAGGGTYTFKWNATLVGTYALTVFSLGREIGKPSKEYGGLPDNLVAGHSLGGALHMEIVQQITCNVEITCNVVFSGIF